MGFSFFPFSEHCCCVIQYQTPCTLLKSEIKSGIEYEMYYIITTCLCDWMLCIASPLLLLFFLLMEPRAVQSISFPFHSFLFFDEASTDSLFHYICSLPFDSTPDTDHHHHFPHISSVSYCHFYGKYTMLNFRNPKKSSQSRKMEKGMSLCHCGFILSQQRRINWNVKTC